MSFISDILGIIGQAAISIISSMGYIGIFILMVLESMVFPLPSELVMPFAGFLAAQGTFNFTLVIIVSALGSIAGSLLSYYMGYYGGNRLVIKYGKYLLLDLSDLKRTEDFFQKHGEKTIFISRFIPVVRHLISIPAGIGKMDLKKFCIYTIIGATIWNFILAYLGYILGKNWDKVRHYSEFISITVAVLLFLGFIYLVYHHIKNKKKNRELQKELIK